MPIRTTRIGPSGELAIKGLLFDKDGTLFDFQATWGPWAVNFIAHVSDGYPELSQALADAMGFDLETGRFLPSSLFVAGTTEQVLEIVSSAIPAISGDELRQYFFESAAQARMSAPVPLPALLSLFVQNGMILGVATNDDEAGARAHLEQAGIATQFDFVAGSDSGFGAKPEPGMQQAFCAATGLEPEEVAMVGDSLHDLEAGRRAGMVTIGVLTGTATREDLMGHATVVLDHIGEIPDWLNLK